MKNLRYPCSNCYLMGPTGPKGDPTATISVNSTTTGSPGTQASVINRGTATNVLLDFIIPTGKVGPAPKLSIGKVVTGSPGTAASVQIIPVQKKEGDKL